MARKEVRCECGDLLADHVFPVFYTGHNYCSAENCKCKNFVRAKEDAKRS